MNFIGPVKGGGPLASPASLNSLHTYSYYFGTSESILMRHIATQLTSIQQRNFYYSYIVNSTSLSSFLSINSIIENHEHCSIAKIKAQQSGSFCTCIRAEKYSHIATAMVNSDKVKTKFHITEHNFNYWE